MEQGQHSYARHHKGMTGSLASPSLLPALYALVAPWPHHNLSLLRPQRVRRALQTGTKAEADSPGSLTASPHSRALPSHQKWQVGLHRGVTYQDYRIQDNYRI